MNRFSLLAVVAAKEEMRQSGLVVDENNTYRVGTIVDGCGWEAIEDKLSCDPARG